MPSNPDSRQNVAVDAAPGPESPSLVTRSSAGIRDEAVLAAAGHTRPEWYAVLHRWLATVGAPGAGAAGLG